MKKVGIVGLGDMGLAMAKNILAHGFPLTGFDLRDSRLAELEKAGGTSATTCRHVGEASDVAFVMVLNGEQVQQVILGEDGLLDGLQPGSTIIVSATIKPAEVKELIDPVSEKGIHLIDSPVSGGKAGAEGGALTVMAAASGDALAQQQDVLDAVAKTVLHVGEEIGQGQTVKAALQAMIGSTFAAIFESLVLGSKAGIKGETLYKVFSASAIGCPLFDNCAKLIMNREFKNTGSHIGTMYKDLGISMNLARETGAAMFTASAAYELFQSGISLFPDEDNWSIVKLLEQIAGTEVTW